MIENLNQIRDFGMEEFIKNERGKHENGEKCSFF